MITVNDISVNFGGTTLFSDVSFAINENDKIALMGKNCRKIDTLKIMQESKPSTGSVSAPKEAVIAYLPQHLLTTDGATVMEEASKAFGEI
jgi:ATP-binding cassette subfamily F protein 3